MIFNVKVETTYQCSLERAFRTPMLCDLSKIHTGFGIMPRVTHTTQDEGWGSPGSKKKVHVSKSLTQAGGFASYDHIIERSENNYWKIQVDEFQIWILGFHKFIAEWKVTEVETNKILIEYTYWLHLDKLMLYPLNLLFARFFWKTYMRRVLENVRTMAMNNEPYLFE